MSERTEPRTRGDEPIDDEAHHEERGGATTPEPGHPRPGGGARHARRKARGRPNADSTESIGTQDEGVTRPGPAR